jgi:hypothetical protein
LFRTTTGIEVNVAQLMEITTMWIYPHHSWLQRSIRVNDVNQIS